MLEPVEILNAGRSHTRRAVHIECEVVSDRWDQPVPHLATDLGLRGMWIDTTFPLPPGEQLLVSFTPPRWRHDRQILALAVVRRVRYPRVGAQFDRPGMAVEFVDLSASAIEELRSTLRGLPPPLRFSTEDTKPSREFVWIDTLLTFEEDRAPVEVSAEIGAVSDEELHFELLSPLLSDQAA